MSDGDNIVTRSEDGSTIICINTNGYKPIVYGRTLKDIKAMAEDEMDKIRRAVYAVEEFLREEERKAYSGELKSRLAETKEARKLRIATNKPTRYIARKYPTLDENQQFVLYELSNHISSIDYLGAGLDISLIRKAIFDSELLGDPKFLWKTTAFQARLVQTYYRARYGY